MTMQDALSGCSYSPPLADCALLSSASYYSELFVSTVDTSGQNREGGYCNWSGTPGGSGWGLKPRIKAGCTSRVVRFVA
jgi:hypothetical protein